MPSVTAHHLPHTRSLEIENLHRSGPIPAELEDRHNHHVVDEEEELHQSSQRRLIRRNTNTRIEYPSTNLETVINVSYDQKKVGLPNKSTQSPRPKRKWMKTHVESIPACPTTPRR
jgi:hypothetical protein